MEIITKIDKKEKSEIEITATISASNFETYRAEALARIKKDFEMPGFRKGNVPQNIIEKNVPEISILEDMAEIAVGYVYPKILDDNKIDAIGKPEVSITKIGKGSDFEFKIKTAVLPEVKLPDYKKIADKINNEKQEEIVVTDEEVQKVILDLQKIRAKENKDLSIEENKNENGETVAENENAGEDLEEKEVNNAQNDIKEEEVKLPTLDDEFAKSFGNFSNMDELREKIKENLKLEKQNSASEKKRIKIVEELVEKTSAEIPNVLIESELNKMIFKMKEDIKQMGMNFEDYLKHLNKSEDDLRNEFKPEAEKRSKFELIMYSIAKDENIKPTPEEIEKESAHLLDHYKGADPDRVRGYVENTLTHEKVFKFLGSGTDF